MKLKTLFQIVVAAGVLFNQSPTWSAGSTGSIKDVIAEQEIKQGIPQDLLKAIAKIESGISPWAVNAGGRAHMFSSKEEAAKYVRELVGEGTTNFSVGCMQLHYASHRGQFTSDEAMLEPKNNIAHAAKLIKSLANRLGSMERAIKFYHSPTPFHHNRYIHRVYGVWAKIRRPSQPKHVFLKTVSLETKEKQKPTIKKTMRSSRIKFGLSVPSAKKRKIQKL